MFFGINALDHKPSPVNCMKLFATFRQRRHAAPLLGVVATPCAMASSFDLPTTESAQVASSDEHCPHASSTKPMSEADCCCDLDAAPNVAKQELPKPSTQLAPATDLRLLAPMIVERRALRPRTISAAPTRPPVYLSTQRLRL